MKKLLLPLLAIFLTAQAYAWTIKESKQDEDVKVIVNDGGTFKEALTVTGATGATSFLGPINSATTTGLSATFGLNNAQNHWITLRGGLGGFLGWNDTTNKVILQAPATRQIEFQVDSNTFSSGTVAGNISAAGAWTVGPSGFTGAHTVNGNTTVTGRVVGAQASGLANNFDVTGINSTVFSGAAGNIDGFVGGTSGQVLFISASSGGASATFRNNNAGGTQKILTNTGSDVTISGAGGAIFIFGGGFWVMIANAL